MIFVDGEILTGTDVIGFEVSSYLMQTTWTTHAMSCLKIAIKQFSQHGSWPKILI